jgi:hypothetical protein
MSKPDALSVSAIEGGLQLCGIRLQVLDGGIGTALDLDGTSAQIGFGLARDLDLAAQMPELYCAFVKQPRLLDQAVFQILNADFIFGALSHQLLYKLGDATPESFKFAAFFYQFLVHGFKLYTLGSPVIFDCLGIRRWRRPALVSAPRQADCSYK